MEILLCCLLILIWGTIWGVAVQKIVEIRGYHENWFWWGFFFSVIACIVACSKPQVAAKPLAFPGDWQCTCGRMYPAYIGTCVCGKKQYEIKAAKAAQEKEAAELNRLRKLKEYKDFLDCGIITQEEFDKKKAEILE